MEQKGISRYQLAKLTNTRFEVVNKWYQGVVERIDVDILARFCFCLDCCVSDIISYRKPA
ncbi:MAG: helix-turn-helix transcriptional regulator [Clostridia bacterium]|nr:helix-turn-helix transcriptional regulator [Clostridia bacterium]